MKSVLSWLASRDDGHGIDQVVFLVRLGVIVALVLVVFRALRTALRHDQVIVLRQLFTEFDLPQQYVHYPSYSTSIPVTTGMGDRLRTGIPPPCVTRAIQANSASYP